MRGVGLLDNRRRCRSLHYIVLSIYAPEAHIALSPRSIAKHSRLARGQSISQRPKPWIPLSCSEIKIGHVPENVFEATSRKNRSGLRWLSGATPVIYHYWWSTLIEPAGQMPCGDRGEIEKDKSYLFSLILTSNNLNRSIQFVQYSG